MLKDNHGFKFTEMDFTESLIHELRKQDIVTFSKTQMEEELLVYRDRYLPIFLNLDCRGNKLNLDKSIGALINCGTIWDIPPGIGGLGNGIDKQDKYIREIIELKRADEYQPYYKLMRSLVKEYITRKQLEANYFVDFGIKLRIHNMNPNKKYTLISGNLDTNTVSWDIVTIGQITRGNVESFVKSPFDVEIPSKEREEWKYLEDGQMESIKVEDAKFVATHGIINDHLVSMNLFSEVTTSDDLIDEIVKCTVPKKNNCQVLSLRKK